MNPRRGAYVFYGARGDDARLVLYRRLLTRYLLVAYRRRAAYGLLVSFDDLLDVVPVRAVPLPGLPLALRTSVEETVHVWLAEAALALARDQHAA